MVIAPDGRGKGYLELPCRVAAVDRRAVDLPDRLGGRAGLEIALAAVEIITPGEIAADGVGRRGTGHLHALGVAHRPTLGIDRALGAGGDVVDGRLDGGPFLPARGGFSGLSLDLAKGLDKLVVLSLVLKDPPARVDLEGGGARREPGRKPQRRLSRTVFILGDAAEEHRRRPGNEKKQGQ